MNRRCLVFALLLVSIAFTARGIVSADEPRHTEIQEARDWNYGNGEVITHGSLVGVIRRRQVRILGEKNRTSFLDIDILDDEDRAYVQERLLRMRFLSLSGKAQHVLRELSGRIKAYDRRLEEAVAKNDYDTLEKVAAEAAADPAPSPFDNRLTPLWYFYRTLAETKGLDDAFLEKWRVERPESVTALLASAQYTIDQGWAARGRGSAATVTEEGFRVFSERVQDCRDLLDRARELKCADPDWYRLRILVAKTQAWEREKIDALADELMQAAPIYFAAHQEMATLLFPRWLGKPGDFEAYAARIADRIGGDAGDELYCHIVELTANYYPVRQFFEATQFDYDRIVKGIDSLSTKYPPALDTLNLGCILARQKEDAPTAARFFARLETSGHYYDYKLWRDKEEYLEARDWARNGAADGRGHPAHPGGVAWVRALPEGLQVTATGLGIDTNDDVSLWEFDEDLTQPGKRKSRFVFNGNPRLLRISKSGEHVMIAGDNGFGMAWNAEEDITERGFGGGQMGGTGNMLCHYAVADSPSGVWLARDSPKGVFVFKRAGGGFATISLESPVRALEFDAADILHVACEDGAVYECAQPEFSKPELLVRLPAGPVLHLAMMPGNEHIVAATADGAVSIIDRKQRQIVGEIRGPGPLRDMALSPDGQLLATAHPESRDVYLWDVDRRVQVAALAGHIEGVTTVSFFADNRHLASGSFDGTIRLWDVSQYVDSRQLDGTDTENAVQPQVPAEGQE